MSVLNGQQEETETTEASVSPLPLFPPVQLPLRALLRMKIGVYLDPLGLPLRQALQEAERLGVSGVQVPLSQIMTVPPPYSPAGMMPSNLLYSIG